MNDKFMKIVVCIKQVPDTTQVKINPETNTLIREGVESIINPFDMYAIEESLRIKEKFGGRVIILSMGPPQVDEAIRTALSLGADEGILLSDRAFAGADTLATSYTLAEGIRKIGDVQLILMGKQAIDGDTGQVGPGVAEHLSIPHITDIRKIEDISDDGKVTVQRLLEDGYLRLQSNYPLLLTLVKEINEPRLPSLRGKINARKAEITVWTASDLNIDKSRIGLNGSPTQVMKIFTPPKPSGGKIYDGEVKDVIARFLVDMKKNGIPFGVQGDEK